MNGAKRLIKREDWPQALNALEVFLADHPGQDEASLLKGTVLNRLERYSDAVEILSDVAQNHVWAPRALIERARAYAGLGNHRAAARDYRLGDSLGGRRGRDGYGFDMAVSLRKTGQCRTAILLLAETFEANRQSYVASSRYYRLLGGCHMDQGRSDEASRVFSRAIKLGLDDPWLLNDLGYAMISLGSRSRGVDLLRRAARLASPRTSQSVLHLSYPFAAQAEVLAGNREPPSHVGIDGQYAWDLQPLNKRGRGYEKAGTKLKDFLCTKTPVLAPISGRVVSVVDGMRNNAVGKVGRGHPWGNHILIREPGGLLVLLAQLSPNQMRVGQGDRVTAGDPLGTCGNSGQSKIPHLQISVLTGSEDRLISVPAKFSDYVHYQGGRPRTVKTGVPKTGAVIGPCEYACSRLK
ncbi:MAG: tetratricopeptide repeat protein [Magnetospiraceae bacterium]